MRMTCNIVTDFAELYQAGLVSPETEKAIHSHLRGCQNCRKYYHDYQVMQKQHPKLDLHHLPKDISETEERIRVGVMEKIRRRRFWEVVGTGAAIGAGSVMLTIGVLLTRKGKE